MAPLPITTAASQITVDASVVINGNPGWRAERTDGGYVLVELVRDHDAITLTTGVRLCLDPEAAAALADSIRTALGG